MHRALAIWMTTLSFVACAGKGATAGTGTTGGTPQADSGPPQSPQILPDRTALGFGSEFGEGVYIGTGVTETLQVLNGGQQALAISGTTLGGPNAGAFVIDQSSYTGPIAAGDRAFFRVLLNDTSDAGTLTATLTIASNAQNTPSLAVTLKAIVVPAPSP
jgi:hypothetical protein